MPEHGVFSPSTVRIMNSDGTIREVEAQSITIDSSAASITTNNDEIWATNRGQRMVRWDINPMTFTCDTVTIGRYEPEIPSKRYIQQYNYNPEQFVFHKVNNEEELYLGVELEIDSGGEKEETAEYVYNYMNVNAENIYCKHDGSLNNGFEIVTHPCTIEYHKQLNYEELFKKLIKCGYKSHDVSTCGLHVHMNRNYFGEKKLDQDLNISKLLYLYEKYWDKVELVARRKSNGYAKRFLLEEDDSPLDLYAKSKEANKYGAINLKHKNTVEIRIFKGTLKIDTYFNTLEFVSVMAHIAKETNIYDIQFVTWDKIKSKFSDELNKYIVDREETVKKEDKEKVDEMMNNRSNALSYGRIGRLSDLCTTSFIDTDLSSSEYESARLELQRRSYEELSRSVSQIISVDMTRFGCNAMYNQRVERSEEEQIQIEINELKTKVRRSRNGLEITNLNRQIAQLENKLRRLRLNINMIE